ncbi:DMT family transporter [Rhizobium paknamense]|uniref:Drug/metabolite transporter (DMT)-like permease n=1 Tax=Rhizobium paknamense TaxID=1206817 RepID=A0ABU0I8B6_9HYPH|nr:DMT family transporter [Rhizobium paknamense]MDQ0454471.1 drug/metabolite transporter (DMT)-like permease [Rhizobium paknamense]
MPPVLSLMPKTAQKKGDLLMFAAAFLAGTGWLFSAKAVLSLPPILFISLRFLSAGLLLGIFGGIHPSRQVMQAALKLMPAALALSLSMMAWITGLQHTHNAGVGAFITACGNLLAPVFGLIIYRWPVTSSMWGSIALAMFGLGFLFLNPDSHVDPGHIWFAIAACCWAISVTLGRRHSANYGALAVSAIQLTMTGLICLPVALALDPLPHTMIPLSSLLWVAGSVVFATCLRFLAQLRGNVLVGTARAGVIMCLEPVWAMLFAMTFLGASLTFMQGIGCAIIMSAILFQVALPVVTAKLRPVGRV